MAQSQISYASQNAGTQTYKMTFNHKVQKETARSKLLLASSSPRRQEILTKMGIAFTVFPSDFAEDLDKSAYTPDEYVLETATFKGLSVFYQSNDIAGFAATREAAGQQISPDKDIHFGSATRHSILSADTIVEVSGRICEKPKSKEQQFDTLKYIKDHRLPIHVKTGVVFIPPINAVVIPGATCATGALPPLKKKLALFSHVETTTVVMDFENVTDEFIQTYVDSEEGIAAAGGFQIQGLGGLLFKKIDGDYANVVGLPFASTFRLIEKGYQAKWAEDKAKGDIEL